MCLALCTFAADDGNGNGNSAQLKGPDDGSGKHIHPTKDAALTSSTTSGISYHGGPVMLGTPTIYYIWYGTWSDNTPMILQNLAQTIGGSPYFHINTTYSSYSGTISGAVAWGGYTTDNYSQGKNLSDASVQAIVSSAINSGRLPRNANGIYFVLTSADVAETSGFCSQYCGWHTYSNISGTNIKYGFIGNPSRCPSSCGAQSTTPNGNFAADSMASIIAHELEESVTDPNLNAWYDASGQENADKCAWKFGSVFRTSNGSYANVAFGGLYYLIQENWVNAGSGSCAMKY